MGGSRRFPSPPFVEPASVPEDSVRSLVGEEVVSDVSLLVVEACSPRFSSLVFLFLRAFDLLFLDEDGRDDDEP